MGEKITLSLSERTLKGKKVRQLRQDGIVPGVVYGPGIEPEAVQVDQVLMSKVYTAAGKHAPVHLTIGTKKRIAMIKDVDVDNVKRRINHVSFHAVRQNEPVEAEVPIKLVGEGESVAEKSGLIVLQALDKIQVRALPMDLPESIEIDITGLVESGDKVTLADAKLDEGVEFVEHDSGHGDETDEEKPQISDLMVASVWEPAALQAANESSAGDAEDVSEVEVENGEEAPTENTEDGKSDQSKKE
ncbi:MAG: 50S ribosomal protein L25 [Candidatus Saccharimonadales bacterium]